MLTLKCECGDGRRIRTKKYSNIKHTWPPTFVSQKLEKPHLCSPAQNIEPRLEYSSSSMGSLLTIHPLGLSYHYPRQNARLRISQLLYLLLVILQLLDSRCQVTTLCRSRARGDLSSCGVYRSSSRGSLASSSRESCSSSG